MSDPLASSLSAFVSPPQAPQQVLPPQAPQQIPQTSSTPFEEVVLVFETPHPSPPSPRLLEKRIDLTTCFARYKRLRIRPYTTCLYRYDAAMNKFIGAKRARQVFGYNLLTYQFLSQMAWGLIYSAFDAIPNVRTCSAYQDLHHQVFNMEGTFKEKMQACGHDTDNWEVGWDEETDKFFNNRPISIEEAGHTNFNDSTWQAIFQHCKSDGYKCLIHLVLKNEMTRTRYRVVVPFWDEFSGDDKAFYNVEKDLPFLFKISFLTSMVCRFYFFPCC